MNYLFYLVLTSMFGASMCYPMDSSKLNADVPELKDETRYPNGTVVGKYSYTDNEGNPIHVKYYADDASYGVELKSVKVLDTSTEESAWQSNNFDSLKPIEPPLDMGTEFLTLSNPVSNKANKNVLQKDAKKLNPSKIKKYSGYETFYQNDINAPGQCEKNKVKVYLNKEKRIIRQALDNYQAKYCDQH